RYLPAASHGAVGSLERLEAAADSLLGMDRRSRAELPYMHPGRVDVIGAGSLLWRTILVELNRLSGGRITQATTSEHDILDGIALGIR
ncbi:MAG: exopolyphosphatase, partial [Renibacterium salmoninarum]|nr:exopolyphosphatase [Renibacterium salmoninarum]